MAVFRYPNSKVWHYDFIFNGQRIRESAKTRSKKLAREAERQRRRQLEEGYHGIKRPEAPKLLSVAAAEWLAVKKATVAPSTHRIERDNLNKHILPALGRKLVTDISAADISKYQQKRLAEGASPKTVNLEVATLRAILRRWNVWAFIQRDVRMLPVDDENCGHALTPQEESALLQACLESRSRSLYPAIVLALSTGMRYSEIRLLRWSQIDLERGTVMVGKSKTRHGAGRVIPLNRRALETLKLWAAQFPKREAEHYVFPSERYGAAGDNFTACAYATDSTTPIHSWKVAWEAARRRAAEILNGEPRKEASSPRLRRLRRQPAEAAKAEEKIAQKQPIDPLRVRFHDLRHTACTRMLEGGVPYPVVASLMGWSAATAIRMAKRYGHIGQKAYREAVELLDGITIERGSFEKSPEVTGEQTGEIQ